MGRTKGAKNKKPARPRTAADKNPAILKLEAIRKALHNYTPGKGDNVIPPPPLPKPVSVRLAARWWTKAVRRSPARTSRWWMA